MEEGMTQIMTSLKVTSGNKSFWHHGRRLVGGGGVREEMKRIEKK
jgi:hypothetical protein